MKQISNEMRKSMKDKSLLSFQKFLVEQDKNYMIGRDNFILFNLGNFFNQFRK